MSPQKHRDRSPWRPDSVWHCLLLADKSVSVADMTPNSEPDMSLVLGLTQRTPQSARRCFRMGPSRADSA